MTRHSSLDAQWRWPELLHSISLPCSGPLQPQTSGVHVFVTQLQFCAQSVQHPAPDTELLQPVVAGPQVPDVKPPSTLAPQLMHMHDVCACTPLACSSTSTRQRRRDQAEATVAGAMAATATALEPMVAGRAATMVETMISHD